MSNISLVGENNLLADGISYNPAPVISPQQEMVSAYVRRLAVKKRLTHVKIAKMAQKKGHDLAASTVNAIIQGTVKSSRVDTLQAIAAGLGEPEEDIISLARGIPTTESPDFKESQFAALFKDYQALDEAARAQIEPFIKLLAEQIQQRI